MAQGQKEFPLSRGIATGKLRLGIDPFDRPEHQQRLVHQMAAQFEEQASLGAQARRGQVGQLQARLEEAYPAQALFAQQSNQGEQVRIPAAQLLDAERDAPPFGQRQQRLGLC